MHAAISRPAGPARKQAAAKGPARSKACQKGSRPSAGQVTPACPWAGAATHKHADTIQLVVRPESRVGASAATACPVALACSREVPIQVLTTRRSPSVLYRRQQQPRHAMERVRRSERALRQIWVKAAARSVGELSGRSECRVRTGAICLVGEAVGKVASHKNAIHIE